MPDMADHDAVLIHDILGHVCIPGRNLVTVMANTFFVDPGIGRALLCAGGQRERKKNS
jgi:hypothetical protein